MKTFVGIDLGSTTTKAILLDENSHVIGRGITNSRSNYGTAARVASEEARVVTIESWLAQPKIDNSIMLRSLAGKRAIELGPTIGLNLSPPDRDGSRGRSAARARE